tara:strand:- start:136 stop:504 length:369 start_codon:yes stop_codon:yes gene_type:complete
MTFSDGMIAKSYSGRCNDCLIKAGEMEADPTEKREKQQKIDALRHHKKLAAAGKLMHQMNAAMLKEFRLKTLSVPLVVLKKAMFSVTGNKQFNRWTYNPTTDDELFRFITLEQIDEVLLVLT